MSKDVEGIEAAKCTIIALGLYLSGFAVKRPHTNKVISSCYRSFLKKPQNFSSKSSLEIGLLLETFIVHASQVLHKQEKQKKESTCKHFLSFHRKTEPMVCTEVYMSQLQDTHSCSNNTKMCCKLVTAVGKSI